MPDRSRKIRYPLILGGLFLCLQVAGLFFFRAHAAAVTYPFLILAPSLALMSCSWRMWRSAPRAQLSWALLSLGLLFWVVGMSLSAWEDMSRHTAFSVVFASDFVYTLFGVPILLAISSPTHTERLPLFIWMDGVQGALTVFLTYVAMFNVVPFSSGTVEPISLNRLMWSYDAENLLLAGAATLRLIAQPKVVRERGFYQIVCVFLWAYAVLAGMYNHITAVTGGQGDSFDLLPVIPFLLLAIAAFSLAPTEEGIELDSQRTSLGRVIDNASPFFYTLALSALGVLIIRKHFYIGLSAITIAVAVYGIRAITLQGRLMQSQQALKQARDRLEMLSLRDGLTNVANRRCFDQTFEEEWNRARRTRQPISLLLIDVDYFKHMNDTYGHQEGDRFLIALAQAMQSVLIRSGDLLARYGGEEFAVILPTTGLSGAKMVADSILDAVHALQFKNETPIGSFATVSIGVATEELAKTGLSAGLIKSSDDALYRTKKNGRNRIEIA